MVYTMKVTPILPKLNIVRKLLGLLLSTARWKIDTSYQYFSVHNFTVMGQMLAYDLRKQCVMIQFFGLILSHKMHIVCCIRKNRI